VPLRETTQAPVGDSERQPRTLEASRTSGG